MPFFAWATEFLGNLGVVKLGRFWETTKNSCPNVTVNYLYVIRKSAIHYRVFNIVFMKTTLYIIENMLV